MKIERFEWDGAVPPALAAKLRALQPPAHGVAEDVAGILAEVERGGDKALRDVSARLGAKPPRDLPVPGAEIRAAVERLEPELLNALQIAAANVRAVAQAQPPAQHQVTLEQGQQVELRELPVASAGIYAPGGTAFYPSSVIMGCVPAKVAGVRRVVVVSPPASDGSLSDVVLAAAAIGGADHVYAIGGAQAIAALALGTESISPVDVVAGPGNRYVQEAKRQLIGRVGIDGIAGPSELMVIAGEASDTELVALDLCAQGEHGAEGLLVAVAVESALLDRVEERVSALAAAHRTVADAPLALVAAPDTAAAVALAQALAPEHLEILTEDAEQLAAGLSTAGAIFLGENGAAAFGDYIVGSNHVLPTGGAGRFQGPLGPGVFRRRISTVKMPLDAAVALADPAATLAQAEGFPVHGESMKARAAKEKT
ncbi:MAG: histidinol dehydrogenase [Solirubrobacterales bacterium]